MSEDLKNLIPEKVRDEMIKDINDLTGIKIGDNIEIASAITITREKNVWQMRFNKKEMKNIQKFGQIILRDDENVSIKDFHLRGRRTIVSVLKAFRFWLLKMKWKIKRSCFNRIGGVAESLEMTEIKYEIE